MRKYSIKIEKELKRDELIDFLSKIYGPNYCEAKKSFKVIFDHEPSISPDNFILARATEGELIGVVRIVERKVLLDGIALDCGGFLLWG